MPRIIALRGKGSSGKTTTIHLLPAILIANGYHPIPGAYMNYGQDFLDVFQKGSRKVGVTSCGDTYSILINRLNILVGYNCDVCICACRTYDVVLQGTNYAVNNVPGYTPQFIPKTYATSVANRPVVNVIDVNVLYGAI